MEILKKILPHKKKQYIMYVTSEKIKETLKTVKVNPSIQFEIINENNIEFYQPEDKFFDLKKLMSGDKKVFLGASIDGQPVGFAGIVFKDGKSCYF